MAAKPTSPAVELTVGERTVRVSNPDRVYFPAHGWTKLDLANYYLAVGDGIVRALRERPCMLHRFPEGLAGEKVHQKRIPHGAPPWLQTVRLHFPRWTRTPPPRPTRGRARTCRRGPPSGPGHHRRRPSR